MTSCFFFIRCIILLLFFAALFYCDSGSGNSEDNNDAGHGDTSATDTLDSGETDLATSDVADNGHDKADGSDANDSGDFDTSDAGNPDASGFTWIYSTIATHNGLCLKPCIQGTIDHADNDKVYTLYKMQNDTEGLFYSSFNGFSWQPPSIILNGIRVNDFSFVLDPLHRAHISYYDGYLALKYAHQNGAGWDITQIETNGSTGARNSIAIDADNHPHISYKTWDDKYELRHAYFNGLAWEIETVDFFVGNGTSLETNPRGPGRCQAGSYRLRIGRNG